MKILIHFHEARLYSKVSGKIERKVRSLFYKHHYGFNMEDELQITNFDLLNNLGKQS